MSTPKEFQQFDNYMDTVDEAGRDTEFSKQFSDARLIILNSNYNPISIVNFQQMFPTSLTTLEFDASATDINYFTAEVNFKYTLYEITDEDGAKV